MDAPFNHDEADDGAPPLRRNGEDAQRAEKLDRLSARYARLARDTVRLAAALVRKPAGR